ncbi:MAG TPA: hypothetical protein VGD83_12725 [Streptosporangiaceae bacterium]
MAASHPAPNVMSQVSEWAGIGADAVSSAAPASPAAPRATPQPATWRGSRPEARPARPAAKTQPNRKIMPM